MTLQDRISMERAVAASAEEAAIRIQIENVMALTPVLPQFPGAGTINGRNRLHEWDADQMRVARRDQMYVLLEMAAAASSQVRERFRR